MKMISLVGLFDTLAGYKMTTQLQRTGTNLHDHGRDWFVRKEGGLQYTDLTKPKSGAPDCNS